MAVQASTKPIVVKLGLKPAHEAAFLNVPKTFMKAFKTDGRKELNESLTDNTNFVIGFYDSAKSLKTDLTKIAKKLEKTGMAWICWQKGGVTDLNRDDIAELVQAVKLDTVSSCALDDEWSALKIMFPKSERK